MAKKAFLDDGGKILVDDENRVLYADPDITNCCCSPSGCEWRYPTVFSTRNGTWLSHSQHSTGFDANLSNAGTLDDNYTEIALSAGETGRFSEWLELREFGFTLTRAPKEVMVVCGVGLNQNGIGANGISFEIHPVLTWDSGSTTKDADSGFGGVGSNLSPYRPYTSYNTTLTIGSLDPTSIFGNDVTFPTLFDEDIWGPNILTRPTVLDDMPADDVSATVQIDRHNLINYTTPANDLPTASEANQTSFGLDLRFKNTPTTADPSVNKNIRLFWVAMMICT